MIPPPSSPSSPPPAIHSLCGSCFLLLNKCVKINSKRDVWDVLPAQSRELVTSLVTTKWSKMLGGCRARDLFGREELRVGRPPEEQGANFYFIIAWMDRKGREGGAARSSVSRPRQSSSTHTLGVGLPADNAATPPHPSLPFVPLQQWLTEFGDSGRVSRQHNALSLTKHNGVNPWVKQSVFLPLVLFSNPPTKLSILLPPRPPPANSLSLSLSLSL